MKQPHEWTNDEGKVLVVKCLDTQRCGYGGFPYPKTGTVIAPEIWDATWGTQPQKWIGGWDRKTECGGGLHGWPWGLRVGSNKEPDWTHGIWQVHAVDPADIIYFDDKAKYGRAEVVYDGDGLGAMLFTQKGRIAWIEQASEGLSHATGDSSASSATGDSSIAAATGDECTVEGSSTGIIAVCSRVCFWRVTEGAILLQRWIDSENNAQHALLIADSTHIGKTVTVRMGVISEN